MRSFPAPTRFARWFRGYALRQPPWPACAQPFLSAPPASADGPTFYRMLEYPGSQRTGLLKPSYLWHCRARHAPLPRGLCPGRAFGLHEAGRGSALCSLSGCAQHAQLPRRMVQHSIECWTIENHPMAPQHMHGGPYPRDASASAGPLGHTRPDVALLSVLCPDAPNTRSSRVGWSNIL